MKLNNLPDCIIKRSIDGIHHIQTGYEYVPETGDEFYNSQEFRNIVSEAIDEYLRSKTEDFK